MKIIIKTDERESVSFTAERGYDCAVEFTAEVAPPTTCKHCGWADPPEAFAGGECPPCLIARIARDWNLEAEFHGNGTFTVDYGAYCGGNESTERRRALWGI